MCLMLPFVSWYCSKWFFTVMKYISEKYNFYLSMLLSQQLNWSFLFLNNSKLANIIIDKEYWTSILRLWSIFNTLISIIASVIFKSISYILYPLFLRHSITVRLDSQWQKIAASVKPHFHPRMNIFQKTF